MKLNFLIILLLSIYAVDIFAQAAKTVGNRALDRDYNIEVNDGGTPTTAIEIDGSTADVNVDNNTLYVDSSADSVGIGTAGPSAALEISGPSATSDAAHMRFTNQSSPRTFRIGAGVAGVTNDGFSIFDITAGEERVYIANDGGTTISGDVSIEKATGNADLTVDGNINATNGNVRILHESGTIANGASLPDIEVGSSGLLYSGTIHAWCMQSGDINDQTYRMYHTSGRGNTAVFTVINEHLRVSGCSFTVSRPSDRFARLTNTSGVSCDCAIAYFGVTT